MRSWSGPKKTPAKLSHPDDALFQQVARVYGWFLMSESDPSTHRLAVNFNASRNIALRSWDQKWDDYKDNDYKNKVHSILLDLLLAAYCKTQLNIGHIPTDIYYATILEQVEARCKQQLVPTSRTRAQNILHHLSSLDMLYKATSKSSHIPGLETEPEQIQGYCSLLESFHKKLAERNKHAYGSPIEMEFAALSIEAQETLVECLRNFLFDTCASHHKNVALPNPSQLFKELDWTLNLARDDAVMTGFNKCINNLSETIQFCYRHRAPLHTIKQPVALLQPAILHAWEEELQQPSVAQIQGWAVKRTAEILGETQTYYNTHQELPDESKLRDWFLEVVPLSAVFEGMPEEHHSKLLAQLPPGYQQGEAPVNPYQPQARQQAPLAS